MKKVFYDAVLKEKLEDLDELIELCDEEGCVLARILPASRPEWESPLSEEEIRERFANPGRLYTTAEVIAYLESL